MGIDPKGQPPAPTLGDEDPKTKLTNPKHAIGSAKLPLHLWPAAATALGCLGMLDGELKYGRSSFRVTGVRASIYVDAAMRHLLAWFEGEDVAPDNDVPHLAHALACLAILVDAQALGKLNDDRMVGDPAKFRAFLEQLTAEVSRLKTLHADRTPRHYTIADNVVAPLEGLQPGHEEVTLLNITAPGIGRCVK